MLDKTTTETIKVTCAMCDNACQLEGVVEGGIVKKIKGDFNNPIAPGAVCVKAAHAPECYSNPDRLMFPLKRRGRRGSGEWERISWDQALDEIGTKLKTVVDRYGAEALAVCSNGWNTSVESGSIRRFMNLLGTPNFVTGVALCMGNTAVINRMTYGWYPAPDFENTQLIVMGGHVTSRHSWSGMYIRLQRALERGAKMIVMDPRENSLVKDAALYLPVRGGTDAAMYMGWLNVIIEEGLYDKAFVENWTVGFEQLKERLQQYPLDRVSQITGLDPDLIRQAGRMYATSGPAIIPWVPMLDKQINSTSAIRLQSILRAICGHLDVPGGELLCGYNPDIVPEVDIELHEELSQAQQDKQLGTGTYNAFTYEGTAALKGPTEKVWGRQYANIVTGSFMAHPPSVFTAMADGDPYPVKALIVSGNNPLMSYANQTKIYKAIMNQDLVVTFDLFKTPTAQLSDYILPGNSWLERDHLHDLYGWSTVHYVSHKLVDAPGECRGGYELWRGLAQRMGFGDRFPWQTTEELYDERLQGTGLSWSEFSDKYTTYIPEFKFKKYEQTGFATPSGKVELYSSVLENLGHDPLPYYRERPQPEGFPFILFVGIRDDEYYQTGQRQVASLRRRGSFPVLMINPADAVEHGVADGEWAEIESPAGVISLKVGFREEIPRGTLRIPRGWWFPEMDEGGESLSGAWLSSDAVLMPDDEDYLDREQGVADMTCVPGRIRPCAEPEWVARAKQAGYIKQ